MPPVTWGQERQRQERMKREQPACRHHLRYAWSTSLLLSKNAAPIWFTNGLMHFAVGDGNEGTP